MPVLIRNVVWKQSNTAILIILEIKNVKPSNLNLFSTDNFIKINHPPFIFECIFHKNILNAKTKCIVKENQIIIELQKAEPGIWNNLHQTVNDKELVCKVEDIVNKEHEHEVIKSKHKAEKKEEIKKFLRDEQMTIRMKEDEAIKKMQNDILSKEMREMTAWKSNFDDTRNKNLVKKSKSSISALSIPSPRKCDVISFSFTPRAFPTPKRESKSKEENEWLRKESEAKLSTGFVEENLSEKEKEPLWLLSKGESFMKCGNYPGAVNAFTYGTQLNPKMPLFYLRLAEAHLKLNNFHKTIESSTKALELLTPVVKQNKFMKAEAYNIRSEGLKNIGEYELSVQDFESASLLLK